MPDENAQIFERLTSMEKHGSNLETRVGAIESSIVSLTSKMDQVFQAVSSHRSFKPGEVIGFVLQVVLLVGALCSGIIYIAGNINSARIATMERDLYWMHRNKGWETGIYDRSTTSQP